MSPRGGPGRDAEPLFKPQRGLNISGQRIALVKAVCLLHVHLIKCPFEESLAEGEKEQVIANSWGESKQASHSLLQTPSDATAKEKPNFLSKSCEKPGL